MENTNGTFIHYRHRFSTPTTKWPIPLSQMWYSIDVGPVHLISYDSEVYSMVDKQYISLQRDWLIKDLKKANENRKHTPWIVAIAHKPMYCSTKFQHDCNVKDFNVRESLEPIFYENSVDLLLGGHQHSYERMWPAYQWSVTARNYNSPSSPVTVVSGAGGSGSELDSMTDPPGPWTAYRMDNKTGLFTSYGIFSIKNSTHLYWEQKAASDNHVIDSFWLIQNNHGNTTITDHEASVSWSASDYITHVKDVIKSNKGLAIGLTSAFSAFLLLGCVCIIMRCKRRRGVTRRWEVVDYDKSFYADVKTEEDDDFAFDDPDPSMTSNGSKPTSKLLSSTNA